MFYCVLEHFVLTLCCLFMEDEDCMKIDKEQFKCLIYDLMMGSRNLEDYPVKESEVVTNEFEEGMYCNHAYNEVYDANRRVCERLDVEEDDDVDCIISNLLGIAKHLSLKMYDYGEYYAQKTGNKDIDEIIGFYEGLSNEKKTKFMKLIASIKRLITSVK